MRVLKSFIAQILLLSHVAARAKTKDGASVDAPKKKVLSTPHKKTEQNRLPLMSEVRWGTTIKFEKRKLQRILDRVRQLAMQKAIQNMQDGFARDRIIESDERHIRQACCDS